MSETQDPTKLARPHMLPSRVSGWLWLIAKIAISGGILAVVLSRVDFSHVGDAFSALSLPTFIAGVAAIAAANCAGGYRWSVLSQRLKAQISPGDGVGIYLAALFVGQILPSTLGVDAVRAWLAARKYKPTSQVIAAIMVDRAFGMIGLGSLLLIGAPHLLTMGDLHAGQAAEFALASLAVVLLGAITALALLLRANLTGRLAALQTVAETVLSAAVRLQGVAALAISLTVHGLLVASVALIAAGLGAPMSPWDAIATVPAAMLIATIPISINGWGLREGAMVTCLALAGVPASVAFAVSILFGIGQFISALPGAAYWIFARKAPAG